VRICENILNSCSISTLSLLSIGWRLSRDEILWTRPHPVERTWLYDGCGRSCCHSRCRNGRCRSARKLKHAYIYSNVLEELVRGEGNGQSVLESRLCLAASMGEPMGEPMGETMGETMGEAMGESADLYRQ
jgi:hypothetical protein